MSKPAGSKQANASKNLQQFIDLTRDESEPKPISTSTSQAPRFGSMDVHGYVDTAKANENIKALLEGAFEDEEEERNLRSKSKSKSKAKSKKTKKKTQPPKPKQPAVTETKEKEDSADLDDLAAQLQGVTVDDPKPAESKPA